MTLNHLPNYSEIMGCLQSMNTCSNFIKETREHICLDVFILPLLLSLNMYLPAMQSFYKITPQPTFTCSKLTIETLE